jgi:asparagine synthase (glutamine-hydrolysing)
VIDCVHRFTVSPFTQYLDDGEKVSYAVTNWYMQTQLLKDTDYMSMWHSVEVRVPFLDKPLMDLVYGIAPEIRYSRHHSKALLIDAFKDVLPQAIWDRPKQGFVFPFGDWMAQMALHYNDTTLKAMQQKLLRHRLHWSHFCAYFLAVRSVMASAF